MLTQYVKDREGRRIGCLVATAPNKIGWSKVHKTSDRFDRSKALNIALGRSEKPYVFELDPSAPVSGIVAMNVETGHTENVHTAIVKAMPRFSALIKKHFKTDDIPSIQER